MAAVIAAFKADAVLPLGFCINLILESSLANWAAISFVRSFDGPSAKIISKSPVKSCEVMAARVAAKYFSSFKTGSITETEFS